MLPWTGSDSRKRWLLYYVGNQETDGVTLVVDFIEHVGQVTFTAVDPDGLVIIDSNPGEMMFWASRAREHGLGDIPIAWYNPDRGDLIVFNDAWEIIQGAREALRGKG